MEALPKSLVLSYIKFLVLNQKPTKTFTSRLQKIISKNYGTGSANEMHERQSQEVLAVSPFMQFHGKWPALEQENFIKDLRILPDFITEEEEVKLLEEVDPYMQRLRYEFDHWDDAIAGYRETERKNWYPHNRLVLNRISQTAFKGEVMPYVHVLDLAESGVIKPHVDSTRFCGSTISGISLLSDCVMRLVRTDEKKYLQPPNQNNDGATEALKEDYRNQPQQTLEDNFYADLLLKRRSLYIMSYSSRYNFTHEVLSNDVAKFNGKDVKKTRRISIICRNNP